MPSTRHAGHGGARLLDAARAVLDQPNGSGIDALLEAPLIIVAAPRSGSTLLYEQLSQIAGFWSIGGESHGIFNAFPHLQASNAAFDSGRLEETHADRSTCELMRACFLVLLRDHRGRPYLQSPAGRRPRVVTLLEKTPRNALNVPFLTRVFPAARYVYVHRDPRQSIASLIEAWTLGLDTGRFVTFRDLPGWDRPAWCFLLPPGWRSMAGRSLPEIAAFQWSTGNDILLDDLGRVDASHWMAVGYDELVAEPGATLERICRFAGIRPADRAWPSGRLPHSRTTLSPPDPDKWLRYASEIEALWPRIEPTARRIAALRSMV